MSSALNVLLSDGDIAGLPSFVSNDIYLDTNLHKILYFIF